MGHPVFSARSSVNLQRNQLLKVCGSFFWISFKLNKKIWWPSFLTKAQSIIVIFFLNFHFRQTEKNSWFRTCQRSLEFFSPWTSSSVFLAFAAFLQVKFANVGIKTKLPIGIATGNFFSAYVMAIPVVEFYIRGYKIQ